MSILLEPITLHGKLTSRNKIIDSHFTIFYGGWGKAGYHTLDIEFDFGYDNILFTSAKINPEGVYCEK